MFQEIYSDSRKIRDYALNQLHPICKHKVRVFLSKLGITREDAEILKSIIIDEMKHAEIEWTRKDQYGERFKTDLMVRIDNREERVRTIWIIEEESKVPELITYYVIT